jgi:chromate transporter
MTTPSPSIPSIPELSRTFARIGVLGFGGPAAQIALMHRILVEEKRWIGEARFLHALNFCMLLPGPEAQQLATYMGWLMHGVRGGVIAGVLFILPGAVIMMALSALYAVYADLTVVQGIFYGVKCAVLAIVLQALIRVGARALKTTALRLIALAAFLALFLFALPFPLVIVAAGVAGFMLSRLAPGMLVMKGGHAISGGPAEGVVDRLIEAGGLGHTRPGARAVWMQAAVWVTLWLAPVGVLLAVAGPENVFAQLGLFFAQMAVVTFGGAYAVLSYVAQAAVQTFGWVTPQEMVDGLGLAETTPGPLILVLQFVGFLAAFRAATGLDPMLAGALGALLTLWVTFVPSFLFIFAGGPYAESLRAKPGLSAALTGITAAVVGVIAHLGLWFALHVLFAEVTTVTGWGLHVSAPVLASADPVAIALSAAAIGLAICTKTGVGMLVLVFALAGLALKLAGL